MSYFSAVYYRLQFYWFSRLFLSVCMSGACRVRKVCRDRWWGCHMLNLSTRALFLKNTHDVVPHAPLSIVPCRHQLLMRNKPIPSQGCQLLRVCTRMAVTFIYKAQRGKTQSGYVHGRRNKVHCLESNLSYCGRDGNPSGSFLLSAPTMVARVKITTIASIRAIGSVLLLGKDPPKEHRGGKGAQQ